MAVLNWSTVCRVKDQFQEIQAQVMGVLLNQNPRCLGVGMLPEFSYKKNHVWRAQMA